MEPLKKIGLQIAKRRKAQQLTHEQLCLIAGISRPTLSELEQGKGTQLAKLVSVAEALNCEVKIAPMPPKYTPIKT
jgi:transcriptional regulator with XRE-family HTH domain